MCRPVPPSPAFTSTGRLLRGLKWRSPLTQGARSNYSESLGSGNEPDDHAIGRSPGGLTTRTHALVDGRGLLLVVILTTGNAGDSPALPVLLDQLRIPR